MSDLHEAADAIRAMADRIDALRVQRDAAVALEAVVRAEVERLKTERAELVAELRDCSDALDGSCNAGGVSPDDWAQVERARALLARYP